MARTFTLAELRTAVQRRGGVEGSYDLTTAILNEYINSAIAELHDLLIAKADDRLVTSATLTTTPGSATVALPSTFYEFRKLEIVDPSTPSGYRKLFGFTLDEAHLFGPSTGKDYRYRLEGASSLILSAATPTAETLRLYFIPYATVLSADGDTLNGWNGYDELVVMMAWRKCVERQRLDTSGVDREIARLQARVMRDSAGRDAEPFSLVPRGHRERVSDDHDLDPWW